MTLTIRHDAHTSIDVLENFDGERQSTYTVDMVDEWWKRFKAAREARGWLQEDVVEQVRQRYPESKLVQGTYSTLERGKRPSASIETLLPIAEVLGVTLQPRESKLSEVGPFDQAWAMFEAGVGADEAEAFRASVSFRLPSSTNAREILAALETRYATWSHARDVQAAGGSPREVALAFGGVGARIEEAADDEGAPRVPGAKRRPRGK